MKLAAIAGVLLALGWLVWVRPWRYYVSCSPRYVLHDGGYYA